jgi:hypothetical protein
VSYYISCDRCRGSQWVSGVNSSYPNRWKKVEGKDLCANCAKSLEEFLTPIPLERATEVKP